MNNNYEICPNCLKELNIENGKCKRCQFDIEKFKESESCLKPFTVLQNKYKIGRPIGIGGFGITYIGWDINLETYIAIKEFYPESFAKRSSEDNGNRVVPHESKVEVYEKGLKRFVEEAQNLSKFYKLNGIVSVKDFFYEYGTAYIVMEYINGVNLKEYLRLSGGKISEKIIKKIMRPVLESMITIHKSGLMHRDISPDNIMVDDKGEITLIDFGSVRSQAPEGEMTYTVVLKHGYAPPEQYYTKSKQGPWTDVYSLCATMYKMLTGDKISNAVERMEQDDYVSPREKGIEISDEMEKALRKGLAVKVDDRYRSVEELMFDLYSETSEKKGRNAFAGSDSVNVANQPVASNVTNNPSTSVSGTTADNSATIQTAGQSMNSSANGMNQNLFVNNNVNGVDSNPFMDINSNSMGSNPFMDNTNSTGGNLGFSNDGAPVQVESAWPMNTQSGFDINNYVNVNNTGNNPNTQLMNDEKELESFAKRKKMIIFSASGLVALVLLIFGGIKLFGKKPVESNDKTTQSVVSTTTTETQETTDIAETTQNNDPDNSTTESGGYVSSYDPYENKKDISWNDIKVKVNNTEFKFGVNINEGIQSEWTIIDDELDEIVDANDCTYVSGRYGEYVMIVLQAANEGSQDAKVRDCILSGIDVDYYEDKYNHYETVINDSIELGKSSYEDVINEFGEGGVYEYEGKKIVSYIYTCQGHDMEISFNVNENNVVTGYKVFCY